LHAGTSHIFEKDRIYALVGNSETFRFSYLYYII